MEYNGKNASLCEAGRSFLKLDNIHEFAHTDIHTWLIHGCCSEFSDSILTTTLRGQKNEKQRKLNGGAKMGFLFALPAAIYMMVFIGYP